MAFKTAINVTPDNVTIFNKRTKALYIGGAGDVRVTMPNGNKITFFSLLGGTVYEFSVTQVLANVTTATDIVRLY